MDVPSKHSATRVCCPDQVNAGKRIFKNNTEERFSQFQKFTAKTTIEKTNAKKRRKKQTATKTRQSLVLNSKRSRFLSFRICSDFSSVLRMFTPNLFFVIPYRPQDGLQTLSKFLPPSSPQLRVPAGPQQQRAPEVCALPNLNREFQRVIGHCRTSTTSPDRSGHCRTSIAGGSH